MREFPHVFCEVVATIGTGLEQDALRAEVQFVDDDNMLSNAVKENVPLEWLAGGLANAIRSGSLAGLDQCVSGIEKIRDHMGEAGEEVFRLASAHVARCILEIGPDGLADASHEQREVIIAVFATMMHLHSLAILAARDWKAGDLCILQRARQCV
jgi:hypothetical protein